MTATAADYQRIFDLERANTYPVVDAFEDVRGFHVERDKLEAAARVLACPLKPNAPNWQHGRVLYAALREYLSTHTDRLTAVDIGTAKGFSALCLTWAAIDAGVPHTVWSCDVLDPAEPVRRNTVAEVDGLQPLAMILAPWPETAAIQFVHATGVDLLKRLQKSGQRVGFAFIDGKHSFAAVSDEIRLLAALQQPGDVVMFDDAHMSDVRRAISGALDDYAIGFVVLGPGRAYALGVRRG